jgi:hypothetical protein
VSYTYRGRITHNYQEFLRWQAQDAAQAESQVAAAYEREASRLRSELQTANSRRSQQVTDIREAARLQAQVAQRQRDLQRLQQQMGARHEEYRRNTDQRLREAAQEIQVVGRNAEATIREARAEAQREVAQVQANCDRLRADVGRDIAEANQRLADTDRALNARIDDVQRSLREEREEASRAAGRALDRAQQALASADVTLARRLSLDTHVEQARQQLEQARSLRSRGDAAPANASAHMALAALATVDVQATARRARMGAAADELVAASRRVDEVVTGEGFRRAFDEEATRLSEEAEALRTQADSWNNRATWEQFLQQEEQAGAKAGDLTAVAIELSALVPRLTEQMDEREKRVAAVQEACEEFRAVDEFEHGWSAGNDQKSPRLVRARIGEKAIVDTYLELDGTFRVDAHGFTDPGRCQDAIHRVSRHLEQEWGRAEGAGSREQATPAAPPPVGANLWRGTVARLDRAVAAGGGEGGNPR